MLEVQAVEIVASLLLCWTLVPISQPFTRACPESMCLSGNSRQQASALSLTCIESSPGVSSVVSRICRYLSVCPLNNHQHPYSICVSLPKIVTTTSRKRNSLSTAWATRRLPSQHPFLSPQFPPVQKCAPCSYASPSVYVHGQ